MVEEKKRRIGRRRTKSFSSLEKNDWSGWEKVMLDGATRMRPVSVLSVWGLMIEVNRVSPSIEMVASKCGWVG